MRRKPTAVLQVHQKPLFDRIWIGTAISILAASTLQLQIADLILIGAALVVVPLGLELLVAQFGDIWPYRVSHFLQGPWHTLAAVFLVLAMFTNQGILAAVCATPWMIATWVIALGGLLAFYHNITFHHRWLPDAKQLGGILAMLLLAIGGTWSMIHRSGVNVMDFSDSIVQLTAIHFHFAGFSLCLLCGQLSRGYPQGLVSLLTLAIAASIMALAAGITASPSLEIAAAFSLLALATVVALLQLLHAWRTGVPRILFLLTLSSMSLIAGVLLAGRYAWGEFYAQETITIATMIPSHGLLMSLGFSVCGLLGWREIWWRYGEQPLGSTERAAGLQ